MFPSVLSGIRVSISPAYAVLKRAQIVRAASDLRIEELPPATAKLHEIFGVVLAKFDANGARGLPENVRSTNAQ